MNKARNQLTNNPEINHMRNWLLLTKILKLKDHVFIWIFINEAHVRNVKGKKLWLKPKSFRKKKFVKCPNRIVLPVLKFDEKINWEE